MCVKISVAMATYNGCKYLNEQLESLSNQTIAPYELVVCDDGSTDRSVEIVRKFATTAPFPVRIYLNDRNLGYSDNFLKAAGLCAGDWIAFCDQDDYWLPKKIEKICKVIRKNNTDDLVLIGHTSFVGDEKLKFNGQYVPHFKRDKIERCGSNYAYYCIVGFSSVVSSEIIRTIDHTLRYRYSEDGSHLGHDQWLGMLSNAVGSIYCVSEPLAIWRRHNSSTTGTPRKDRLVSKIFSVVHASNADLYEKKSHITKGASQALSLIASKTTKSLYRVRLFDASNKMKKLANRHDMRASLYAERDRGRAIMRLLQLIYTNSYFDLPICSLGWRSFLKDCAYAFGIIRKVN